MYVLEIKFYTVDKFDKLYRVDGKVYERRDACLSQPLSHKRILDWEEQVNMYLQIAANSHWQE